MTTPVVSAAVVKNDARRRSHREWVAVPLLGVVAFIAPPLTPPHSAGVTPSARMVAPYTSKSQVSLATGNAGAKEIAVTHLKRIAV
jgi:hypothetical protein